MQLVDAVEAEIVYPVEAWPTQILTIIFALVPQMSFALSQLEKVIVFCYVHNVPVNVISNLRCQKMHLHTFIPKGLSILIWTAIVFIKI